MRVHRTLLLVGLLLLPIAAFSQDIGVVLTPSSGPPGTMVTVDLVRTFTRPFTAQAVYAFSFGDDVASQYARTNAQFTFVGPTQVRFTVPFVADCGTHYFGVVAPSPTEPLYPLPLGRTPFEVTGSCNPARRNTLDILNYNIQFLPDEACLLGPAPPCKLSIQSCFGDCGKTARAGLLALHPDLRPHDVIVWEEAFSDDHRQMLRDGFIRNYAHQSPVLGTDHGITQDGGVVIFSKWPIEEVRELVYDKTWCNDFADCHADKGVLYARVNKGGQRYHIFGTHTDAGDDPADVYARRQQLAIMSQFIYEVTRTWPTTDPVIMAGDFNIDKHLAVDQYNFMLWALNATHPFTFDHNSPGSRIGTNKSGNWIDYVLYRSEYLRPDLATNEVFKPRDARSPYTDDDLSDHYAVLGHFTFNTQASTLPPANHAMDFGYYYVDGKYGDYRSEVNCYTNLYYALAVHNYVTDTDWWPLFQQSLDNAVADNRRIHLNLNWDVVGAGMGRLLDMTAPYWNRVARIEMQDEPGWSRAQTESNIAQLRSMLQARGLPQVPIGIVYTQNQSLYEDAIFADGLDWVGLEAYVNPPGSPNSADNIAVLNTFLDQAKGRVPADKSLILVMMAYDRNGAWGNIGTLRDLQTVPYLRAFDDPRVIAITMFSYGRPGGSRDHPELKGPHQDIARAIFGLAPGQCVDNPPPPPPPPPPCNKPGPPADAPVAGGPTGCFNNSRPTFTWSAVADATDYKLALFEARADGSDPLLYFEPVSGTSLVLPFSLTPEMRYRWKVKARNCKGDGPYSEIKYFTYSTHCSPPTVAPTPIAPQGCITTARPVFTWTAVADATAYRIVVSPADHDDFFIDQFPTGTSLTSPVALNPNVQYRFKVRAVNDAGPGPWSGIMYFIPFCGGVASAITSPLGCTGTTTPVFSWLPAPGAVQYWLLAADSNDFSAPTTTRWVDVHLTATSIVPSVGFTPGKTFYAKVKTILDPSSTTAAAWSPTISFVCGCAPQLSAMSATGEVRLSWTGLSDASSYTVKRAVTMGGTYQTLIAGLRDTAFTDTSFASPAPAYFYVVTANLASGGAINSREVPAAPASATTQPVEDVQWTNVVGLAISGNSVTKTAAEDWGNGGASSTRAIASGDGFAEFTAGETNTYRMVGLTFYDVDQSYYTIDFALYPAADGWVYVYEKGVVRARSAAYAAGDRLRVAIESGAVKYKINGATLYTSTQAPVYPLIADTALYSTGATVNQARISGSLVAARPIEAVTWTNVAGLSLQGTTLSKTAATGWGNGGASSTSAITSNGGFVAFTVGETNTYRMVGLSRVDTDQNYASIEFALYPAADGGLYVWESGVGRGLIGYYKAGDRLQVLAQQGVVAYRSNGVTLYVSPQVPAYPLVVDTAFYSTGATISDVRMGFRVVP